MLTENGVTRRERPIPYRGSAGYASWFLGDSAIYFHPLFVFFYISFFRDSSSSYVTQYVDIHHITGYATSRALLAACCLVFGSC
jgi:hypothetical protein